MESTRTHTINRVFVAHLIGTSVFDLLGDEVGRVHDVVALLQMRGELKAVGFAIEVSSRRRAFLPLSRITAIEPGVVITTGLMNIRRFTQRHVGTLAAGEPLDRAVTMRDGSGNVTVRDMAIERDRGVGWKVIRLLVQWAPSGLLGLRRGETFTVRPGEVSGLVTSADQQGATALLATLEDLKPANLADVMRDLPQDSQMRVVTELTDERLTDVLEEFGNEDVAAFLPHLEAGYAAHVLNVMQSDDAADLVADFPQLKVAELLGLMEPEEAEDVCHLMAYDEYTAGGLMITELIILFSESTVVTFLAQSCKAEIPPALAATGPVCRPPLESPTGKFVGMVHFQRALRKRPQRMVGSIVDTDIDSVHPEDSIGTAARLLATYNLMTLPVLDDAERLLDAVSIDDVLDHLMPDGWRVTDEAVTDETIERGANA